MLSMLRFKHIYYDSCFQHFVLSYFFKKDGPTHLWQKAPPFFPFYPWWQNSSGLFRQILTSLSHLLKIYDSIQRLSFNYTSSMWYKLIEFMEGQINDQTNGLTNNLVTVMCLFFCAHYANFQLPDASWCI